MNKVILIGNLTRDPETRTTGSGLTCCQFTLAINRRFKNADGNREADYINVVTWRQTADLCARYLAKGRKVCVVGQIQTRSYDAQDGSKRYVTEVVADEVEFLTPAEQPRQQAPVPAETYQQQSMQPGFTEVDDDELPF